MGVQGLWQVLEPVGKPVALETLENKVLGVDVSLWLHQAVKGMRDGRGEPVSNAHLVVLLQRVCKLLFYRIKPVFVFDGGVPQLKRQTLAGRQQRQAAALEEAQRQRVRKALIAHAQQRLRKTRGPNPPGPSSTTLQKSPQKSPRKATSAVQPDMFELPPLPAPMATFDSDEEDEDGSSTRVDVPDTLDVDSEDFSQLPANIRHDILVDLHERQRYGSRRNQLPKEAESFSSYQMSRLLKKRNIQQRLEEARRDLSHFRSQQWMAREEQEAAAADVWRVASEANAHQVLLRRGPSSDVDSVRQSDEAFVHQRSWTQLRKGQKSGAESERQATPQVSSSGQSTGDATPCYEQTSDSRSEDYVSTSSAVSKAPAERPRGKLGEEMREVVVDSSSSLGRGGQQEKMSVVKEETVLCDSSHNVEEVCDTLSESSGYNEVTPVSSCRLGDSNLLFMEHILEEPREKVARTTNRESVEEGPLDRAPAVETSEVVMSDDSETVDDVKCAAESSSSDFKSVQEMAPDREETSPPPVKRAADADGVVVEVDSAAPDDTFADVFSPKESEEERVYRAELDLCLEESRRRTETEANRLELQGTQLSQQMAQECQELLRLLGMPYLVSPEEAEAQCALLEQLGLTQGTVTDDSDVWLFGGTSVYKHFFQREKLVEHFAYDDILRHFGLDRQKMIAFALLSGSDYTTGIRGVGPVSAMEIISEFGAADAISTLSAFKEWLEKAKLEQTSPGSKTRSHLVRFELTSEFPSRVVVDAYLNPATDSSTENFTWGTPDLDALRSFGLQKLGWTQDKMDSLLLPVLKRLQEKQCQSRIDSYFSVETIKREQLFPSKRLRRAAKKVAKKQKPLQEPNLSEDSD